MKNVFAIFSLALMTLGSVAPAIDYPDTLARSSATSFPYNMTGQVFFDSGRSSYIGSGTVIRPKSILTAGHNLYDPQTGWSTDVLFRRGAYGTNVATEKYGRRIYLLGGYRKSANRYGSESARTFASDTGGVKFGAQLANGGYAGWSTDVSRLSKNGTYKVAVGYGAQEPHDGDFPLQVVPDRAFYSAYRTFHESRGAYFEGGMSGGPVFVSNSNGKLVVLGVIVSGSDYPYRSGGIRILDGTVANFIRNYL